MPGPKSAAMAVGELPAGSARTARWATSPIATPTSRWADALTQRRKSPSESAPTSRPWESTTKTIRAWFAVIRSRARRTGSCEWTRNGATRRSTITGRSLPGTHPSGFRTRPSRTGPRRAG